MARARAQRLFRRRGGRVWQTYVYDEHDERHQRTTHCHDYKAALIRAQQLEREAADPVAAAAARTTLEEAFVLLLEDRTERARAGRRSLETVKCYRTKAGHWLRVFGRSLLLARFNDTHGAALVDKYISTRREEGAAETTIHKELVVFRAALKLALRRGLWRGNPDAILPVAFGPEYSPRTRALTRGELVKLLGGLQADHAAQVAYIVATSASWGESERAARDDVGRDDVRVRGTKTKTRSRVVPIVTDWQRDLLRYALAHAEGDGARLFRAWSNVRRDLHAACARVGIDPCSPNDLRRTHGRWLRGQGVAPGAIGLMLGHADGRMAERVYARPQGAELGELVAGEIHRRRVRDAEDLAAALREAAQIAVQMGVDEKDVAATLRVAAVASHVQQTGENQMDWMDSMDSGEAFSAGKSVPRDRIELPTRGFSIPCSTN